MSFTLLLAIFYAALVVASVIAFIRGNTAVGVGFLVFLVLCTLLLWYFWKTSMM